MTLEVLVSLGWVTNVSRNSGSGVDRELLLSHAVTSSDPARTTAHHRWIPVSGRRFGDRVVAGNGITIVGSRIIRCYYDIRKAQFVPDRRH